MIFPFPILMPLFGRGGGNAQAGTDKKHARLCLECRHFRTSSTTGDEFGRCQRYLTETQQLVGAGDGPYASLTRTQGPCGRSGKGWEPKEAASSLGGL